MNIPPRPPAGPQNPLMPTGSQLPANQPYMPPADMWLDSQSEDEGLNLASFLQSLRRRWLPATLIGGVLATILSAVLFFMIPETYEAVGLFRVSFEISEYMNKTGRRAMDTRNYAVYQQTQSQLLTSPFVLNAALRELQLRA